MRVLVTLAVLAVWTGLLLVGWWVLRDIPVLRARDPALPLTARSNLYLDRSYRLDGIPSELAGAVLLPTFRHGREPVHIRLTTTATAYLLAAEGTRPPSWVPWQSCDFEIFSQGAATDLTEAYRRELRPGDHAIDPVGPQNVASPILLVSSGPVYEVETPGGMLRRAEVATRGFPRRSLIILPFVLVAVGVLLAALLTPRAPPSES